MTRRRTANAQPDEASRAKARWAAAVIRRYHRYEALRPLTCPNGTDHYLLEPAIVAGDVLLICPTCGFADLLSDDVLPTLARRASLAASFWRGIPY